VLIQPSTYAFFVWAPIFLSSLAYAAYQAMPANRGKALFRRTGWLTAAAFFFNGVLTWSGGPIVGQVLVFGMLACLAAAFLRISRSGRGVLSAADRWLVALPVGLYCGWITAATVVGALQTLVRIGLPAGGAAEASLGCLLLLAGGLFAAALVRAARGGPSQGYLAYAAAVLWALLAVVANQYDASVLTTAAALSAALVALALVGGPRGRHRQGGGTPATPV
jgi:hypothetical protein